MTDAVCFDTSGESTDDPTALSDVGLNEAWLSCLLDIVAAAGIRRAVVSPGGRSSAMVLAVHERASFTDVIVTTDERTGAFTALGMIKASGEPAMVVTTSGSAVANLVPALTEADECALPLVLITCDRPRVLRGTGFGQMIDHIGACRAFVRASVDLPDPTDDPNAFIGLRERVTEALAACAGARPGPVHINIPFAGRYDSTESSAISPTALREARRPAFFQPPPARTPNDVAALANALALRPGMRGIIVAGPECGIASDMLARFAARTGFPVLADAASGLRSGGASSVIGGYDALSARTLRPCEAPELIIRCGFAPVMPAVQNYLLAHPCPTIRMSRTAIERDFLHSSFAPLVAPDASELDALADALAPGDSRWRDQWVHAAEAVAERRRGVADVLPWGEVPAVREIFMHTGFDFVHFGNSMPIRHADFFYEPRAKAQPAFSNRGVWGIDGTLGTFLGEAVALDAPGLLVLGDLAFLHDLPALANLQRHRRPACVCIINNAGGAIFDLLPLARLPGYREAIRNPYQCDIAHVAAAFGLRFERAQSRESLRAALDGAVRHDGVTIVEALVPSDSGCVGLRYLDAVVSFM
jgi:2-succinyl-5-enolpyruvyl-6-hydroxy-3-cyclohexene-1-carboxylate synthase